MNEDKNKKDKTEQAGDQNEVSRTVGQEKPGATMEQRKEHMDTDDAPKRPADQTPEERYYNDQNSDLVLAKKQ